MTTNDFAELVRRIRAGDQCAAEELVRQYEPEIRREVRLWLRSHDPRLRRAFDTMDICQSVLASFFLRAAVGEYDLSDPHQLLKLLKSMVRNKLVDQAKYQRRQRRDIRRAQSIGPEHLEVAGDDSPSQEVAGQELLQEMRNRLSEEERRVADLRAGGQEWTAIAAALGGTAEGRRKQLARAADRVLRELGLEGAI
jgi:RNA polymerase sigma-70 factor (ECF subfamily)